MSNLAKLREALGNQVLLIDDPAITISYSRDQAPFAKSAPPLAVLLARSAAEISITLKFANEYNIPVIARGAGSGLSGGANSSAGSIVISLEKMTQILTLDKENQIARVQSGVINSELDNQAKVLGLAYLPDPASREWSTIGGNAATNAGGMCCVKYGVTAHHVRAMQVVLSDGEIIEVGNSSKKSVTTLDLLHLFIGSEGTLGIITELTVNLEIRPNPPSTLIAIFPNISSAAKAATVVMKFKPSMLELIDKTTVAAVQAWHPMGFEVAGAVLLMQSDDSSSSCEKALEVCNKFGAFDGTFSDDPADAADLIRIRKLAYPALERMGASLLDDVAVPITKISELVEKVEAVAKKHSLLIGIFGHAGDGNMHPTIVYDHGDSEGKVRAEQAFNEIIEIAQSLGGTASGEHGIGSIKLDAAKAETSHRIQMIQREIKKVLDPNGILNPGKKFT